VISIAVQTGLSSTVRLQRSIKDRITKIHYESSHGIWRIAREVYLLTKEEGDTDYSYILKAEPQIRDNMHKILFEIAAKYGYTEVSRQKSSDDTVGPINQRLNACGAALREFSHRAFPFPDPLDFGTRTHRVGTNRKRFRIAGYEESSFGPRAILAHPDLPSMDFGDAVRSHNEYLAAFCAIHNVPVRETIRYSNLFLLLSRPHLEYIYSEYKSGKSGFQKGVNRALRQVKELIKQSGFQPTMHIERTVTKGLEIESRKTKTGFFEQQASEAKRFYGDHVAVAELNRLRNKGTQRTYSHDEPEDSCLTTKDVEHIREKATKRARVAGSIMHRRIADLFPSPWLLNDVIFEGHKYAAPSDYAIISEVPLQTLHGAGKADLVLLERTITEDGKRALWMPRFVLEIKTRKGHSWFIQPDYKVSEVRPDGSPLQRIVSKFPMNDYPLDDDMWDTIVRSTPSPQAHTQLETYAKALVDNFKETTHQKLGRVLRGTVVIDSLSEVDTIRRLLERLLVYAYESVKDRVRRIKRTIITPSGEGYGRIALVVHEQTGPGRKRGEVTKAPWGPIYNPFKVTQETNRHFILYLAGKSPTSAGNSASWNARNYYGLQMLFEIKESHPNTRFHWVDLADQFSEPRLAEARLRLRSRGYSENEIVKCQPVHIREFFEKIEVRGFLDDILSFLYNDGALPSFQFDTKRSDSRVIIITGADTLQDATPATHRERLQVAIDHLLKCLPDDEKTSVVWFDSPVPSVKKAVPYSSRALLPFYENSTLAEVVTEIIWNLPIAPRKAVLQEKWNLQTIGDSPMHDDIRVIVRHSPDKLGVELTHVPFLRGWSKRFRNQGKGLVIRERELDDVVPDKALRTRMKLLSLTMLPWLVHLWPEEILIEDSKETLEEEFVKLDSECRGAPENLTFTKVSLNGPSDSVPNILELLRFRLPDNQIAKSFLDMTAGKINSQRLYRSPNKLRTQPKQAVPTPLQPEEVMLPGKGLEQEWTFGIKFEAEDDVTQPSWIVVQDPANESRMLVGCFTNRPPATDDFSWAETKREVLTHQGLDDILGLSQTIMICRRTEAGIETWSSMLDDDEVVDSGVLELIGQGRSTIGHLRALRQTFTKAPRTRPASGTRPSESFYARAIDSLQRYLEAVTRPTPVTVRLEMMDGVCKVIIIDEEEVLQDINIEYTTDLISLLRWPIIKGGPMFTDAGKYVTWSVFDDIHYEDLDFIEPYITFRAARTTPEELPKRIAQFFDDAETLPVSIEHDQLICPIALGEEVDHGACWRITLPPDCPDEVTQQLGEPMTGEEVNGLLAPERLYAGKLCKLDITVPSVSEKDESVVFHEDRYIRMLLRANELILKRLKPGTYLSIREQKWMVDITWDGADYVKWTAQSIVSGLSFKGVRHTIELTHGQGAEQESARILEIITSNIPRERIVDYSRLEERVLKNLQNLDYSKTSPPCELRILELSENTCRYGVFPVGRTRKEAFLTLTIEVTGEESPDAIIEGVEMSLSEGELSAYSIRNKNTFLKKFMTWVNKVTPDRELMVEVSAEWTVTLFVNEEGRAIHWEAEQYGIERQLTGLLYDDLKVLLGAGIREAVRDVRETFELDIIPELGIVSNLDVVLKRQVPEVVREIRQFLQSTSSQ
jgi:hypothetical protein